jgi:hypothetical protein
MRALLVYESMFGNTRDVARAVAAGLRTGLEVEMVEVGLARPEVPAGVDLLVVGGPTHALGLSRPQTRLQAAGKAAGPLVSPHGGLREWLAAVGHRTDRLPAAAFDTRLRTPIPGAAANAAARRLRHTGYRLISRPRGFYVGATTGPLLDRELARATEWGRRLAAAMAPTADRPSTQPTRGTRTHE